MDLGFSESLQNRMDVCCVEENYGNNFEISLTKYTIEFVHQVWIYIPSSPEVFNTVHISLGAL